MTRKTDMKRVLITGGVGFIGANLTRLLLQHGTEVVVLDNFEGGDHGYLNGLPVHVIQGDIRNREALADAVSHVDGVVHLAAQTGVPGSLEDPEKDCEVNVLGTLRMLEACRDRPGGHPRVVFASSNAPLGRQPPPATETKVPIPISPYGASKLAGEAYCLAFQGSWEVPTVVLRFANVYGPYSGHKSSVVAQFCKRLMAGKPLFIDGDGQQTRDMIYVEDLCWAILLGLTTPSHGEVFQIATGVATSILDLGRLLQQVAGIDVQIRHGPPRLGDIEKNFSEIGKASRNLGWKPRINLRDGLQETWQWFLKDSPL